MTQIDSCDQIIYLNYYICKINYCQVYKQMLSSVKADDLCLAVYDEFMTIQVGFMVKALLGPDHDVFSLLLPLNRLAMKAT